MPNIVPMVSMSLDDEEQYDYATPMPIDKPEYPYELRIALTDKTLAKLGLDPQSAMGAIGGTVLGQFIGRVTSASMNQMDGGEACCRIEIQIEDLGIQTDDEEQDQPVAKKRGLLYASQN
jgi:hypothetical protein